MKTRKKKQNERIKKQKVRISKQKKEGSQGVQINHKPAAQKTCLILLLLLFLGIFLRC